MPEQALLISCEHAVNHVPKEWAELFAGKEEVLQTHRGYDPGAAELAYRLGKRYSAPVFNAGVTRLLIDHNRSPHNRALWSEFSRRLSADQKLALASAYYKPYRELVGRCIEEKMSDGQRLVHLSIHSFTPVLNGQVRKADIGILYDPKRNGEKDFGRQWKAVLEERAAGLKILLNSPYRGCNDGHQSTYRKRYQGDNYLAIELEINQALVAKEQDWPQLQELITESLGELLGNAPATGRE